MVTEERRISDVSRVELTHDPHSNPQSLAAALEVLIHAVGAYKDDNIPTVSEDDYEHLVVLLGDLTDVVREDENHIFAPLMEFAILLIEKYDHVQMPELAAHIENCRAQQVPNAKSGPTHYSEAQDPENTNTLKHG